MLDKILNINPERIAVAEFFGAIGSPEKTTSFVRMLKAIEENKRVRALVIDIDSPGGGGKVPLLPEYVEEITDDSVTFRNYAGERYVYKQPKLGGGCGSEPVDVPDIVPIAVGKNGARKPKERDAKNGKVPRRRRSAAG